MTLNATKPKTIEELKKELAVCERKFAKASYEADCYGTDYNDAEHALGEALEREKKNNV